MSNPIHSLLHSTTAASLVTEQQIVTVQYNASIEEAVQKLKKNSLQAVPVMKENECLGFVDVSDILAYVVSVVPADLEDYLTLIAQGTTQRAMAWPQVSQIVDRSGADPYVPVFVETPLSQLLNLFGAGQVHRVLLVNREQQPSAIVSQTDIVKFVASQFVRGDIKNMAAKSLTELGFAPKSVISVLETESVVEVLKKMAAQKVTAVAVTNAEGALVANFSASDLFNLYDKATPQFQAPVREFLEQYSERSLAPICVRVEQSFAEVAAVFAEQGLHHGTANPLRSCRPFTQPLFLQPLCLTLT
ncbi:MAG: hypothetical protein MHM6MM_000810 [Cercozoa sp. M6MM]